MVARYEDSQGFVYVDYYDTKEQLESAWSKIQAQFEQESDDEENS